MRPTKRRYWGPVSMSSRAMSSGMAPTCRLASTLSGSRPSTWMRPAEGGTRPVTIFSVVDLPAPLRPSSPRKSPGLSEKLTSFTATLSP